MLWDLWSAASGETFDTSMPPCQVDTAATALSLVADGLGHGLVYAAYSRNLLRAGRIAGADPVDIDHVLMLQPNAARRPLRATGVFIDWLARRLTEHLG
jgi:DNA-binding transcriptional LysR family regulator